MKKMTAVIGIIFATFFSILILVFSFQLFREGITSLNQAMDVKKWSIAKGVLQDVHLIQIGKTRKETKLNVKYSYVVEGVTYEGSEVSLGTIGSSREQNYKIYSKLKSAKSVEVRFNPANPRQSTLTYGATTLHFVSIVLGVMVFVFVLGMSVLLILTVFGDAELSKSLVVLE